MGCDMQCWGKWVIEDVTMVDGLSVFSEPFLRLMIIMIILHYELSSSRERCREQFSRCVIHSNPPNPFPKKLVFAILATCTRGNMFICVKPF